MADEVRADDLQYLVQRCLADDQIAMLALVNRYQGQVFGLCYRMLGQRQDAEDMAQETFVRALRSLSNWDQEREFLPWLLAIAGNRCRTCLAQRMRRPVSTPTVEHLPDRQPSEEGARHLAEELDRALEQIRPEYRQAFLLFHEQELSYTDIAAALDCPLGTVKTWVHRARQGVIQLMQRRGVFMKVSHELPTVAT
ncbi:MAG TPA: RNA polymerase sigma factor [Pirellulales bacterium]